MEVQGEAVGVCMKGDGKKWVSTAAPLCSFLRNRCEAKTKDAYFCSDARIFFFLEKTKFKMEKENRVHLEMRYVTHSKCLAT